MIKDQEKVTPDLFSFKVGLSSGEVADGCSQNRVRATLGERRLLLDREKISLDMPALSKLAGWPDMCGERRSCLSLSEDDLRSPSFESFGRTA